MRGLIIENDGVDFHQDMCVFFQKCFLNIFLFLLSEIKKGIFTNVYVKRTFNYLCIYKTKRI